MPGLLVSARSLAEAQRVMRYDGIWLDLKEPSRGSLGRPSNETIEEFIALSHSNSAKISIAGGELSEWSNAMSSEIASILPPHCYIKFGLSHYQPSWIEKLAGLTRSLSAPEQLILVHYADHISSGCCDWDQTLQAAQQLGCRYVLVDTFDKSQGGLLDHYPIEQIRRMIQIADSKNLGVALAGSLQVEQLASLMHLGAHWLGFRGAVCVAGQRTSELSDQKLQALHYDFANRCAKGQ